MARRREERNNNNRTGVSWKTLVAVLSLAVAIVAATIAFVVGQASAYGQLGQRVNQLEQDRAAMLEKLSNIEKSVDRIERKLFDGGTK